MQSDMLELLACDTATGFPPSVCESYLHTYQQHCLQIICNHPNSRRLSFAEDGNDRISSTKHELARRALKMRLLFAFQLVNKLNDTRLLRLRLPKSPGYLCARYPRTANTLLHTLRSSFELPSGIHAAECTRSSIDL